jgi:hypothetical protein
MIAFTISLNGTEVCTAGVRDVGVLSAIVTWVRRRPKNSRRGRATEEQLVFEVGGLDSDANEHLKWLSQRLRVGDRVAIDVIESESVDTPKRRHRDDPGMVEREKRRYFERLKKEYAAKTRQPSKKALKPRRKERG